MAAELRDCAPFSCGRIAMQRVSQIVAEFQAGNPVDGVQGRQQLAGFRFRRKTAAFRVAASIASTDFISLHTSYSTKSIRDTAYG